jgi:arylformamidase
MKILEIKDISHPLHANIPVWPGHEKPLITLAKSHENGDGVQITDFVLGAHTGTHLDAPRHFIPGGGLVTDLDLNVLIGLCTVLHYTGSGPIEASFFAENIPEGATRLLLKCDHNAGRLAEGNTEFFTEYAGITPDAAVWLVAHGVTLIGTDYLSIGPFHSGNTEVHNTLLGNKVIIVEGLDLREITAGNYTLICLPILTATDGVPCRAVLLPSGAL